MTPIRFGVLGLTHDHLWVNLDALMKMTDGRLVAVADPHQELLDKARQRYGCPTYLNHEEMAEKEQLDAVLIWCDNATGSDLTVWAAERGLHVMIEKPMAATLAGADRMVAAAKKNNVRLMVNWPVVWRPQVQAALDLVAKPEFGKVMQITHRTSHGGISVECTKYFREWIVNKELSGAGALMDVCCYGVNFAQMLLGRPDRVTAVAATLRNMDLAVEDAATIIMSYPHAMATSEGSWNLVGQPWTGYLATFWGTKATVMVGAGQGGRLWMATAEKPECVELPVPQPKPHMHNGIEHFIWALTTGGEFHPLCFAETCRNTQEVLEAAIRSVETHREVTLPLSAAK